MISRYNCDTKNGDDWWRQDPAGGEYAQRGVLLLLRIGDERVTLAASDHSSLIERTVRMVDTGFKNGMQVINLFPL